MNFNLPETRLEELRNWYSLLEYQPFLVEEEKLQKLKIKKTEINAKVTAMRSELEAFKSNHSKKQLAGLLDECKEAELQESSQRMKLLREELNDAEQLLAGIDQLINDLLPDYEAVKEQAIYQLNLRAKKDHEKMAKDLYILLKQIRQIQLQELEFRYAVSSTTGQWMGSSSHQDLYNHRIMNYIGDEKEYGTPFFEWVKTMKENGYHL
jgi:hypothetical protein